MYGSVDRELERAYAMGLRNREILALLGQHCTHAVVEHAGGYGMAEQASGLPIDMRTIRCPFAKTSVGSAMNMEWVAVDFYRANCVGCPDRRPVGVPNLATFVATLDEQAAQGAEEAARRADAMERRRVERSERRAMLAVGEPLAGSQVLNDLDVVDAPKEPGSDEDGGRDAARRRIVETARLAPEAFTPTVVDQLRELAPQPDHSWAFEALRHLARSGHVDARETVSLALATLAEGPRREAAHVLIDLRDVVIPEDLAPPVMSALIHLAGVPQLHGLTGAFGEGRTRDRSGLVLAMDLSTPVVLDAIKTMLESKPSEASRPEAQLWVPPGVKGRVQETQRDDAKDEDRAAAAVAARVVLTTVPDLAGVLAPQLLDALEIPDSDDYISPVFEIVETLAGLLLEQPDVAIPLVQAAGATKGEEQRRRLFDIIERASRRLRPARAENSPPSDDSSQGVDFAGDFADHRLGPVDIDAVASAIFAFALDRLGGDWGHDVAGDAGRLVESFVRDHAAELRRKGGAADAVIGHLIATAENPRARSVLAPPGPLDALEQITRDQVRFSIMRELREALAVLARSDTDGVLDSVEPILDTALPGPSSAGASDEVSGGSASPPPTAEEKAALDLHEELITLLGEIACDSALVPGILRRVLPRLTTHLLGRHPQLRAASIKAWRKAAEGDQALPSTLSDCLPVLLEDSYFIVIGALLDVLPWLLREENTPDDVALLVVRWVMAVEPPIRAERNDWERRVVWVLRAVARRFEDPLRARLIATAFALGEHLSPYELRHHLQSEWPAAVSGSAEYARMCVRALGRPEIRDDHDELISLLLEAWPGCGTLSDDDIALLLADSKPEYPLMSADALEVLGRIGRHDEAATLAEQILEAVPDVPAADRARLIAQAIVAATRLEIAVAATADGTEASLASVKDTAARADSAVQQLRSELDRPDPRLASFGLPSRPSGPAARMNMAIGARVNAVRALIRVADPSVESTGLDRAASACEAAAAELREVAEGAIPTAAAYASYAEALDIIACIVRADAATRRADGQHARDQLEASHRRASVLLERLAASVTDESRSDIGDPLIAGIVAVAQDESAAEVGNAPALARALLRVPLPLRVIEGPRWGRSTPRDATEDAAGAIPDPIVVCLLSLDDHPLTEHAQVLHPNQVYTLSVDARGSGWPPWADTLELEPVSALTESELTLPTFQVRRPEALADDGDYQFTETGAFVLRFALAPGRPAAPVRMVGRFTGPAEEDGESRDRRRTSVDVAGHPQIRVRPFDTTRDLLTDQPQVDARLLELFARLQGRFPDEQLEAFARFLTAILLAAERIQFDKAYKLGIRVSEATFHDDLERRLRDDPTLGGRLSRRDPRSLGFLDLDHDGINAELKVERTTPVSSENCHKYLGQPTQYATGAGMRLSILVVLDMSRKEAPPGALENYVWLMQPSAHGLDDPAYPSIVAVVVINANNRVPSGWSRHRIAATPIDPTSDGAPAEGSPGLRPGNPSE